MVRIVDYRKDKIGFGTKITDNLVESKGNILKHFFNTNFPLN